jgi:hypothetical protein
MAVLVETQELWQAVVASIVAGVGVTSIFSVAIWSAARGGPRAFGGGGHGGRGRDRHRGDGERLSPRRRGSYN